MPTRFCRRCRRDENQTRFARSPKHRCLECNGLDKAERAARIAARAVPITAPVKREREPAGKNLKHLAWVRTFRCAVPGRCTAQIHPHHVRAGTGGGTGKKPPDAWAVPLCAHHHEEGHRIGWRTFEAKYRVDLRATARFMVVLSPHLTAAEKALVVDSGL